MAHQNNKKFVCSQFQIIDICDYEVTGDEDYVIKEAERHLMDEHTYQEGVVSGGYSDIPGIQDMIRAALINAE